VVLKSATTGEMGSVKPSSVKNGRRQPCNSPTFCAYGHCDCKQCQWWWNGTSPLADEHYNVQLRQQEASRGATSPMDLNVRLENGICKDKPTNRRLYLSIVGSLNMYAA